MRVFLTGGTGFIGGYVLRELAARGHVVTALVRSKKKAKPVEEFIDRRVVGDLHNISALEEGVAGADAIVHVAGLIAARRAKDFQRVNAGGAQNLLGAANRVAGGLERFVLISSISAAGPSRPGEPLREEYPPQPISLYGESKLAAETEAWRYIDKFGVTVIRPPMVYGPGDTESFLIFKMVQRGRVWTVSDPRMQLSLVYVRDLANGIVDALESPAGANETFYFAGDERPRVQELVQAIEDALKTKATVQRVPVSIANLAALGLEGYGLLRRRAGIVNRDKIKELLAPSWLCSSRNARTKLGWRPEIDFQRGIRQAADWYLDRGWLRRYQTT